MEKTHKERAHSMGSRVTVEAWVYLSKSKNSESQGISGNSEGEKGFFGKVFQPIKSLGDRRVCREGEKEHKIWHLKFRFFGEGTGSKNCPILNRQLDVVLFHGQIPLLHGSRDINRLGVYELSLVEFLLQNSIDFYAIFYFLSREGGGEPPQAVKGQSAESYH